MRDSLLCAFALLCAAPAALAQGWAQGPSGPPAMPASVAAAFDGPPGAGAGASSAPTAAPGAGAGAAPAPAPASGSYYYPSSYYGYGYGYGYYPYGYSYNPYGGYYPSAPAAPVTPEAPVYPPAYPAAVTASSGEGPPPRKDDENNPANGPDKDCFWAYLAATSNWMRRQQANGPLVTTGSPDALHPGALGQPGTAVLFGNDLGPDAAPGVRLELGTFLDDKNLFSLEAVGLAVFPDAVKFHAASDARGNPIITRPFFNATLGEERSFLTSTPGTLAGSTDLRSTSALYGAELNFALHGYPAKWFEFDRLVGLRYLRLAEGLTIQDQLTPLAGGAVTFLGRGNPVSPPNTVSDMDHFRTSNDFYGGQLGGRARATFNWLTCTAYWKVALGVADQSVSVLGSTTMHTPGGNVTAPGGILALPSNSGTRSQAALAFVPEGGISLGVKITPRIQATVGYSFLFWNTVVRPGAQIDRVVNTAQVPTDVSFGTPGGPLRPLPRFQDESFWMHTLSLGLEARF